MPPPPPPPPPVKPVEKPGECPPQNGIGGCVVLCNSDEECADDLKCCGSCPKQCTAPLIPGKPVKPKPSPAPKPKPLPRPLPGRRWVRWGGVLQQCTYQQTKNSFYLQVSPFTHTVFCSNQARRLPESEWLFIWQNLLLQGLQKPVCASARILLWLQPIQKSRLKSCPLCSSRE